MTKGLIVDLDRWKSIQRQAGKYAVFFGATATGVSAHVPDLPGCVAAGSTLEKTRKLIAETMELHLSAMREDGDPIPEPTSGELVEVGGV